MNFSDHLSTHPWLIFLVTALGVGMSSIDAGIVNVALPTITHVFNATISQSQWTISGYLLIICISLPLFGRLSDIFSKRKIYLIGFVTFTLSSAFCGAALNLSMLIISRLFQGIGAAMILANNQAILMMTMPEGKRGRALGINSMLVAAGAVIGPGIGGLLIHLAGWRFIFYVNLPVGVLGCLMGFLLLPYDVSTNQKKFDVLGAIIFAIGMTSLLLFLNDGNQWGWISLGSSICFLLAIIFLPLFVWLEKHVKVPMLDFSLFKNWLFFSGNVNAFLVFVALSINMLLLPFYLSQELKLLPAAMGLFLLIPPLLIMLTAPISGYLADRMNQSYLSGTGLGILWMGLLMQSLLTPSTPLWLLALQQMLIGMGCGLFNAPNNLTVLQNAPENKLGIAVSINSFVRNVGKVFGTVIATTVFVMLKQYILKLHPDKTVLAFTVGFRSALWCSVIAIFIGFVVNLKRGKALERNRKQG